MAEPYQIGLIGCGLRGVWHLHSFRQAKLPFTLAAVADPDPYYTEVTSRLFAAGKARVFRDGNDMLDSMDNLDGVIIASPNHVHRGPAVAAMNRKLSFLLEKPVAASLDDMGAMWKAHVETRHEPIVGFNLRYTPFYDKVHELCSSGALGQILVVNAEELMSDDLSVVFARGDWRPNPAYSGGLMAEKCSHDMDLLNWLAGGQSQIVHSFARRSFLTPRPGAAESCKECQQARDCRFVHGSVPEIFEIHWPPELREILQKLNDDTCVFSKRHTYPDHQTLNIAYDNGVLCNFTVAQCQPATRRTIHVLGSEGRLYGVLNENQISLYRHGRLGTEIRETISVHPDESGHNGGDSVISHDFFALLAGNRKYARPGLREGIEASLLSLAADQSVANGRPVRLDTLRRQVFSPLASEPLTAAVGHK